MRVDLIDDTTAFGRLRPAWEALYRADPEVQLFLSWRWLAQLFARRPKYRFIILAAATETEGYVALLPLRLSLRSDKTRGGFRNELYMAGNYWADYTGLLCRPGHETRAIPALADGLLTLPWARLHLDYLSISPRRLELLLAGFDGQRFAVQRQNRLKDKIDGLVCPYVELPDDFDTYLGAYMSAKTRQKLRRFGRRLERSPELRISHADGANCDAELDALAAFWRRKWAPLKGEKVDHLAGTYRQILWQAGQERMLHLPVLWRGDRPLGVLGSLVDRQKKTLLFFVAGRDESCRELPVGLLLHGDSIRWAIANGLRVYDFLSGNEPYKYSYGVRERRLYCVRVDTRSGRNLGNRLDPGTVEEALTRATRWHREGKLREAERGYRQVLRVRPDSARARRRYARLLAERGD